MLTRAQVGWLALGPLPRFADLQAEARTWHELMQGQVFLTHVRPLLLHCDVRRVGF